MDLIARAKSYYHAYERLDPDYIAGELADGFTFTSPFDDAIGREEYFNRCWPKEKLHQAFDFISVAQDGDSVLVVYRCTMTRPNAVHPAMHFRNAERLSFEQGRLKSVEVFFGDPPNGLTRRQFAEQCSAA